MMKIKGKYFIIIGIMLLVAALSLIIFNLLQDKKSGKYAYNVLTELKSEIQQTTTVSEETNVPKDDLFQEYEEKTEETKPVEMQTVEINGELYIGIISIPSLEIELPVMSQWSYPNLKNSPCRYMGTVNGGDLIIAAHNYNSHFGKLSELYTGDSILFTDVAGNVTDYEIINTEIIDGRDIETMEFGSDNDWDITLFTCTLGGKSRVSVRAVKKS